MGAGTSALQVIDGSHACLYYYLPIQHITVPWVLHTQQPTQKDTRDTHLLTERGYSTSPRQGSMNSVPL